MAFLDDTKCHNKRVWRLIDEHMPTHMKWWKLLFRHS